MRLHGSGDQRTINAMTMTDERLRELRAFYGARVSEQDTRSPGYALAWARLEPVILGHGGAAVVPPLAVEFHLGALLTRGVAHGGTSRLVLGEPSRCHANVARLWERGVAAAIATGYALSDDGLWRQHTWGVDEADVVIETTEQRSAYFGFALSEEEAADFAENEFE